MSLEGKSLHILTPMYGGMASDNYIQSFAQLILNLQHYGMPFSWSNTRNESLISRARNRLGDNYMKQSKHTHAVYIDADIGFEVKDILHLMDLDLDVAGPPCVKKTIRWDRVQRAVRRASNGHPKELEGPDLQAVGGEYVFNFEKFQGHKEVDLGKPVEVETLGTGLMMIRRNVFEKFIETYPDRWYESRTDPAALPGPTHDFFRTGINRDTREYESEDYCFCQDVHAMGFKIWLCPWMKTSHSGNHLFQGDLIGVSKMIGEI